MTGSQPSAEPGPAPAASKVAPGWTEAGAGVGVALQTVEPDPPPRAPEADLPGGSAAAPGATAPAAPVDATAPSAPAPAARDPFSGIDVDLDDAPEPAGSTHRPGGVEALGMSTIRAQQRGPAGPASDAAAGDEEAALAGGWLVRVDGGEPQPFKNLESVRAWLGGAGGEAGGAARRVEISSDGAHWRPVDALLGMEAPAQTTSTGPLTPVGGSPTTRGPTSALREAPDVQALRGTRAGAGLVAAVVVSTLLLVCTVPITVQALGLADLSGALPFDAVGLGALVPKREAAPVEVATTPEAAYRLAAERARKAASGDRWVDAALAWRQALEIRETREGLDGLASAYASLGDRARADEVRDRLAAFGRAHPLEAPAPEVRH